MSDGSTVLFGIGSLRAVSILLEEEFGHPVELVTREPLDPQVGPRILRSVEYVGIGD